MKNATKKDAKFFALISILIFLTYFLPGKGTAADIANILAITGGSCTLIYSAILFLKSKK